MSNHALLSASSAQRWLACTPSAVYEKRFPDRTSEYAVEGTAAHNWASLLLYPYADEYVDPNGLEAITADSVAKYGAEMPDAVNRYVDVVTDKLREARLLCPDAMLFVERRLNFARYVPEGFGTGDAIIIADGLMEVIDLKYGKGVPVSAEENPQIRLYGLGAIEEFGCLYDVAAVRMTIVQPRLDSVSSETLSVDELTRWGDAVVAPRARLASVGGGVYAPGEHCRFCRAKNVCRARADDALELTRLDFAGDDPKALTLAEIAAALACADRYKAWIADIDCYTLAAALEGETVPGYKVVEGRSVRRYTDDAAVAKKLTEAGYDDALIFDRKLLGLTAMERLVGKKPLSELLGGLIEKPAGKPTLVPITDKRAEYRPNQELINAFKEEISND